MKNTDTIAIVIALIITSAGIIGGYSVLSSPIGTTLEDVIMDIEATGLIVVENVEIKSPSIIFIVDDLTDFLSICEQQATDEVYLAVGYYSGSFYCFDKGFTQAWKHTSEHYPLKLVESQKQFNSILCTVITGIGIAMLIGFSMIVIKERPSTLKEKKQE